MTYAIEALTITDSHTCLRPNTFTEFWRDFASLNQEIRTWDGVGLSVGAGTNGANGKPDDHHGVFMIHGYSLTEFPRTPFSFVIRPQFKVDTGWFFSLVSAVTESLLEEGFPVATQEGHDITHLFHNGFTNGHPTRKTISFGVRLDDEDACLRYLRGEFGKMKMLAVHGTYGEEHP